VKTLDNLTVQQKRVAQLMVDNEFGLLTEDGKKLTVDEVAELGGIGRSSAFEWRKKSEFRAYMSELAEGHLDANRAKVYASLMKLIDGGANGLPSVKALDLYMRRFGLLTDRQIVETGEEAQKRMISEAERQQALDKLDQLLDSKNE
jgi:hypothetical protein